MAFFHFTVNNTTVQIELKYVSKNDYQAISDHLEQLLFEGIKNREAISRTFLFAVARCPQANPSDLWHHVLYRTYLKCYKTSNASQSWVRAGGEGLEEFIGMFYNPILRPHGVRLIPLFSRIARQEPLRAMGLTGKIGNSKLDVMIEKVQGRGFFEVVGGVHVKASLAERVSDDEPASRAMMAQRYLSVLWTLDVKSFPPPHGDLVNRGELGSVEKPSDKRRYVEEHGAFDACFSFNLRSSPSPSQTKSGKRIFVQPLLPQPDAFAKFLIEYTRGSI